MEEINKMFSVSGPQWIIGSIWFHKLLLTGNFSTLVLAGFHQSEIPILKPTL